MAPLVDCTISNMAIAANLIRLGELVAFPTDTVYGLGADAYNCKAIEKIFHIKQRPKTNPLIVHYATYEQLKSDFFTNEILEILMHNFIPGPLTVVLRKLPQSKLSPLCSNFSDLVACRIPNHPLTISLIKHSQTPIAAPSANIANTLTATKASHVLNNFSKSNLFILDDKTPYLGLESTVLDISDPQNIQILRPGMITQQDLAAIGINIRKQSTQPNISPGMLDKHYSPKSKLRLNANYITQGEALLLFGDITFSISKEIEVLNLSKKGNLNEAAYNLFDMLWKLDGLNMDCIAVVPIPNYGLGVAINDRLNKAQGS